MFFFILLLLHVFRCFDSLYYVLIFRLFWLFIDIFYEIFWEIVAKIHHTANFMLNNAKMKLRGRFLNPTFFKEKVATFCLLALISLFQPQGKVEMTVEVLSGWEAEAKPAGQGREDPNQHPVLEEPK